MTPSERAKELGVPFPQIKTLSDVTGRKKQTFTYMFGNYPLLFDAVCIGASKMIEGSFQSIRCKNGFPIEYKDCTLGWQKRKWIKQAMIDAGVENPEDYLI